MRTIVTGTPVRTSTAEAITWVAQQVGFSPETSHVIGDIGDLFIGLAGTLGAGLASSWRLSSRLAAARGTFTGSLEGLSAAERRVVEELLSRGRNVEIVARGTTRTADFRIDGVLHELKTLSGVANQTSDGLSAAMVVALWMVVVKRSILSLMRVGKRE